MSLIKNLKFSWSKEPLIDIASWELPDSGLSSLMGPSGCGKSSLIRCLLGLEECEGQWIVNGEDLMAKETPDRKLAVVFQSLELFPHFSGEENILFSAKARGLNKDEAFDKMLRLSKALQIEKCIKQNVQTVSGGEAQRVAIARALISSPLFLFLDEPFSSLDESLRDESRDLVKKVLEDWGIAGLMVTHDLRDVESISDHRFVFENKTVVSA